MIITTLAVLALSAAPSDTPIEPIPASLIQLGIDAGVLDESCDLYRQAIPLLAAALDDRGMAMDVVDAYIIWSMESGWEPEGAALTLEAEELLTDFLHDCVTP